MKKLIISLTILAIVAVSCGTTATIPSQTRGTMYPKMYEEQPVSLLIMPPINNTSNVEAKEYLYTTISRPLIDAGYYVVSPLLAMEIFKTESAYDAEVFLDQPLDQFYQYFGADAVVFSEINNWTKLGFGIRTNIRYFIKSTHTSEILFDRTCDLYLDLSSQANAGSSLLSQVVNLTISAVKTAATEHIVAARKVNSYIFSDIPRGKYSTGFNLDQNCSADDANITTDVR